MLTDIKLSKAQLSKIIQSKGFLGALLEKFSGLLMKDAALLAKNILAPLADMTSVSAVDDAIQRKMLRPIAKSGADVSIPRKGITLVILNKDIDDIILIIK